MARPVACSLVLTLVLACSASAADLWRSAVTAPDIDIAGCTAVRAGKAVPVTKGKILAALGLAKGDGWSVGAHTKAQETSVVYTLRLTRPVAVGTIMARRIKGMEVEVAGAWQPLNPNEKTVGSRSVATLPVGSKISALRITQTARRYQTLGLSWLRLLSARLVNLTPAGTANGESEYTQFNMFSPPTHYAASRITKATGSWRNTGVAQGKDKITSPPISSETPVWFILSWQEAREFAGLHIDGSVTEFTLYAYTGPDGVNPAVATRSEWRKLRGLTVSTGTPKPKNRDHVNAALIGRGPSERFITFGEPVKTRGFKIVIEKVVGYQYGHTNQVADIAALHAYANLGEDAVPDFALQADTPPYDIEYSVPQAGTATLVVEDESGKRVRNLIAREPMTAGQKKTGWDLRDVSGSLIAPGTYKWRGITGPVPSLRYEMTAYPNVRNFHPENTPWRNGHSGSGGWLADHAAPSSVATFGDIVYLGSPCSESGESLAVCNTEGKRLWGHGNFLPFVGPSHPSPPSGRRLSSGWILKPTRPRSFW
jgi:hypothetical protein